MAPSPILAHVEAARLTALLNGQLTPTATQQALRSPTYIKSPTDSAHRRF